MVKLHKEHPLLPDGTLDLSQWLSGIVEHRSSNQTAFLLKAYQLVEPIAVDRQQGIMMVEILHDLGLDVATLAAGMVYHAYLAERLTLQKIKVELSEEVAVLMAGVHKIEKISTDSPVEEAESLRRMLLSIVEDVRVVLLKLASHTCRMREAVHLDELSKQKIAKTTQEIYVPLANRLGIGQIKWELEDLSFRFQHSAEYKHIAHLLDERRLNREEYIAYVVTKISQTLQSNGIVDAAVFGRAKHIYSIWKKMQRKGVSYDEIYDVRAIRILVASIFDCYATLGTIHSLWKHIPKEFDDYIASPKGNGYRSLHTTVIGPSGKTLEVQIRTEEMHNQAELGVAAHWRYKENVKQDLDFDHKLANLRQVLTWQEEWAFDVENNAAFNLEVFQDRVYVLTPKGKIIDLPQGATVLDFAYFIHTEIGHRCRGSKVNGNMVPLTYVLQSGDRIEILTAKIGGPSRDWLNRDLGFIKTVQARTKVSHWFKRQNREHNIQEGKVVLDRELKRLGVENLGLEKIAEQLKVNKIEDMLAFIGCGDLRVVQVINAIQKLIQPQISKSIIPFETSERLNPKLHNDDIMIAGIGNLLSHMARCCKPVPGDEIIGYITIGNGVSIHRKDCMNILQAKENNLNRLIQVEWGNDTHNGYLVEIAIKAFDREGLLRDISGIFASEHVNVIAVNILTNKQDNTSHAKFSIEISGIELLSKVLNRIQQLTNVIEVRRESGG